MSNPRYRILVSWRFMIQAIGDYKKIFKKYNISYDVIKTKQSLKKKQLVKFIDKYDGIICGDDEINKTVLDKAKKLKVISKWGTGLDSINVQYAKRKGIKVFNTPNAFSNSVSQLTWGFILNLSRNIFETHRQIQKGYWPKISGHLLKNKYLGVIGLGKIGLKIIENGQGFGMKVLGNDIRKINDRKLRKYRIKKISKFSLLKKADIIILCVNLNKTSYRLIDFEEFKYIKKNSIIINVSRGSVINEMALIKALKNKKILGAGIDVFENEPLKSKNKLLKFKNCILSSHNAFNTIDEVKKVNNNSVKNLINGLLEK